MRPLRSATGIRGGARIIAAHLPYVACRCSSNERRRHTNAPCTSPRATIRECATVRDLNVPLVALSLKPSHLAYVIYTSGCGCADPNDSGHPPSEDQSAGADSWAHATAKLDGAPLDPLEQILLQIHENKTISRAPARPACPEVCFAPLHLPTRIL